MQTDYYGYLCALLEPLGVYALGEDSVNAAELYAAGREMDAAAQRLERAERESILPLAEEKGLSARERLFARCPAAAGASARRAAIAALMRIGWDDLTLAAINRAIRGCGIRAEASETEEYGKVKVRFPGVVGEPEDYARIRAIILDIMPCHLLTEFVLRLLTWAECADIGYTWGGVEQAEHSWESFQEAVET